MSKKQTVKKVGERKAKRAKSDRLNRLRQLTKKIWLQTLKNLNLEEYYSKPLPEREATIADQEYRRLIRQLPTEDLEFILQGHEDGILRRAPNTIESILDELAVRAFSR